MRESLIPGRQKLQPDFPALSEWSDSRFESLKDLILSVFEYEDELRPEIEEVFTFILQNPFLS